MGISSSCESTATATAKLILQDGELIEFPYTVKVYYIAEKYPSGFVCNSDAMEFGKFVLDMQSEEELLPGHLYFVLPLSRLRYPLQPEEMAALAVKASLALMKSQDPIVGRKDQERESLSSDGNSVSRGMKKNRPSTTCKGSGWSFTSSLTVIRG